jgi:hypothetical protein
MEQQLVLGLAQFSCVLEGPSVCLQMILEHYSIPCVVLLEGCTGMIPVQSCLLLGLLYGWGLHFAFSPTT